MAEDAVAVVRRTIGTDVLDAAEPATIAAVVERLAPDVEFVEDPRFPEAGVYRGREELTAYLSQFAGHFDEYVFELEDVLDAGEGRAVMCLHLRGRGRSSSAAFDARAGWIATVRDGRVAHIEAYFERDEALAAAGLG